MKRIHLIISGHVQGVGFRYFCLEQAKRLGLVGYARNQKDGSVEVEAQGPDNKLEQFINDLSKAPRHARITNIERAEAVVSSSEKEFQVG